MATAREIRSLIEKTTTGNRRRRVPEEVKEQVRRYAARRRTQGFSWEAIGRETGVEARKLRGVAVGRKNHYGSRSERGTRVAALFYSLIESAKLCGVEPRAYLREATLRAARNPGTVTLARDLKPSGT
jgi:transposase